MRDWNPSLYLQYNNERIQPSIDLVARIDFETPKTIIDIGCGPGNSTQILAQRWPDAKIIGIDNSPSMIERAQHDYPTQEWRIVDAGKDTINDKFDIVFSNATIQWIPNHANLLQRMHACLTDGGVLSVQIPLFWDMPLGIVIASTARHNRWSALTASVSELFTIQDISFYYDHLSCTFSNINLWVTEYIHIMHSHSAILEMIRSTGLKPYLERLENDDDRIDFEGYVLHRIEQEYPSLADGKVLFPFKRLFFVARK